MTDDEIVTLAVKAYGDAPLEFSPLTDDGDALRLAVNLRIHLTNSAVDAWASTEKVVAIEPLKNDPCAASRRAIVRAAAEIGKYVTKQEELQNGE